MKKSLIIFFLLMATCAGAQVVPQGFIRPHAPVALAIGQSYQGGIIAYILLPGDPGYDANVQKGLIAATANQSTSIVWSNINNIAVGATAQGTAIGTGQANTTAIVGQSGCTDGAAYLCDNLTVGGYSDWYLPSKDELNKLYEMKLLGFGGFASNVYWSSSEASSNEAWLQFFGNGDKGTNIKGDGLYARAVRSFPTLPTVTTTAGTSIGSTWAFSGGNVTDSGEMAVTARGVCWSSTTGPTVDLDTKTTDGTGTGIFTSSIANLEASTLYYVRAYATSSAGTAYGNEVSFTTRALAIGDFYQGGTIAYIWQPGDPGYIANEQHGFIVAIVDQNEMAGIKWGIPGSIPGGTSTAIGRGIPNTDHIIDYNGAGTTYAAGVARAYTNIEIGTGIYSDWNLPSKDELAILYLNRAVIGMNDNYNIYWSSSEANLSRVWGQSFNDGTQGEYPRTYTNHVRAVRFF